MEALASMSLNTAADLYIFIVNNENLLGNTFHTQTCVSHLASLLTSQASCVTNVIIKIMYLVLRFATVL